MGHQSRTPQPSPLQMLAILQARAEGLSAHEIHRRTGHSNSSVLRWFDAWGHDAKTFNNWVREFRVDLQGHTFDDYYPKPQKPIPIPHRETGEKPSAPKRFLTALGLK